MLWQRERQSGVSKVILNDTPHEKLENIVRFQHGGGVLEVYFLSMKPQYGYVD